MAVKISTGLPNCREGRQNLIGSVDLAGMLRVARLADELGYYSLWPNEFFATRPDVAARYPDPPTLFDAIVTMAYAASATRRIRITPSTIVLPLPLHEPLLLGRQLATLDVFSGGRITLGIGLGGSAEEFRRLHGALDRPNRGQMMDECLQALRALWTERQATFRGRYVSFEDVETHPKPVQDPFPIFMAGHAEGALRRLAAYGQGWIDSTMPPDELRAHAERLRTYAAEAGRGDARLEVARQFYVSIAPTEAEARANHTAAVPATREKERGLIGTPDQIRAHLREFEAAGATELCAIFYSPNADSAERQLRLFAAEVMPAFA
jgi:probable F420-dependent oxidoreductase